MRIKYTWNKQDFCIWTHNVLSRIISYTVQVIAFVQYKREIKTWMHGDAENKFIYIFRHWKS